MIVNKKEALPGRIDVNEDTDCKGRAFYIIEKM